MIKDSHQKLTLPNKLSWLGVTAALVFLGYFYTAPASRAMLEGKQDVFISQGWDATSIPLFYDVVVKNFHHHPSRLLFGTVYTDQLNPPYGYGLWIPWVERILVIFFSPFLSVDNTLTAYVWALMVINGLMFYAMGRFEGWGRGLSLGLAICFAFNPFTRARSIEHGSLVGIYFLPAIFLGIRILQKRPWPKSVLLASALFVFALMTAHYYIMILVALSPLLVWYYFRGSSGPFLAALKKMVVALVLPLAFLSWNFLMPLPPSLKSPQAVQNPPIYYEFLLVFCARPIDYFSGDVSLGEQDLNPVREAVNHSVKDNLLGSSPVERSNGIRWLILFPFFALAALYVFGPTRRRMPPELRSALQFFVPFAVIAYMCSLTPGSIVLFNHRYGLSHFVHLLIPNFRVPSRFGPAVHFAVLMAFGWAAHWELERKRKFLSTDRAQKIFWTLFPGLMVLDFAPTLPVQMRQTLPPRIALEQAGNGECGTGLFFPYWGSGSGGDEEPSFYGSMQQMRRTNCVLGNLPNFSNTNNWMIYKFGKGTFIPALQNNDGKAFTYDFVNFIHCSHLDWIVFRPEAPEPWRSNLCQQLGWKRVSDDSCHSLQPSGPPVPFENCMR